MILAPLLPALLLAGALAMVGWSALTGRSFAARVAALATRHSRPRMLIGWAAGIAITYGLFVLVALALIGRLDALRIMPPELHVAASDFGIVPGALAPATITASLALGAALGVALLWWRARQGRGAIGLGYRSAAAIRDRREWPAALALSLSAGIAEEAFFRLLLPLLGALVTGSGMIGCGLGLAAFTIAHRHQGIVPMLAVAVVGAALTWLYLASGALWLVMALHTAIDVNALIVRPLLHPAPR